MAASIFEQTQQQAGWGCLVGQAAATCVAGTVGIVEDENPAAATCVAGSSSDVCRKSALAGACDFPLPFAGQVLRSTVHSFPSNSALSFR